MIKRVGYLGVLLLLSFVLKVNAQTFDPVSYVSTLVGTNSKYELSTGNTYPATALPWGMNFWSPQTGKMVFCVLLERLQMWKNGAALNAL